MSQRARAGQRIASIGLKYIAPEHLDRALDHYAKSAQAAIAAGRKPTHPSVKDVDDPAKAFACMPWEDHDAALAQLAKDNPSVARRPDPGPEPLETIKHPGDYSQDIEQAFKKTGITHG